jgi:alkyl sulfatase BDS1-like metallo-beta-lactamase superfamily hydrolase
VRTAKEDDAANCGITVSAEDFARMLGDSALMLQFYFNGKLKVSGDPMLAAKLQKLFALVGT